MRALKALKLIALLVRVIPSLLSVTSSVLLTYLKYLYKMRRARKEAQKVLEEYGIPRDTVGELLEVLVPKIGGLLEWVNLMKSESCC